jgi:Uncharacterized protein involved in tolerance to divalent cations
MDSRSEAAPITLVLTTEADPERAEALASALVERRLAACVSLMPIRSCYRWNGDVERAEEVQLLIKTSPEGLAPLRQALDTLHSYDTPECLHWTASASAAYGSWLREALAPQVLPHQRLE